MRKFEKLHPGESIPKVKRVRKKKNEFVVPLIYGYGKNKRGKTQYVDAEGVGKLSKTQYELYQRYKRGIERKQEGKYAKYSVDEYQRRIEELLRRRDDTAIRRANARQRMQERWANYTEDDRKTRINKMKAGRQKRLDQDRLFKRMVARTNRQQAWKNKTKKQIDDIVKKRKDTLAAKKKKAQEAVAEVATAAANVAVEEVTKAPMMTRAREKKQNSGNTGSKTNSGYTHHMETRSRTKKKQ